MVQNIIYQKEKKVTTILLNLSKRVLHYQELEFLL